MKLQPSSQQYNDLSTAIRDIFFLSYIMIYIYLWIVLIFPWTFFLYHTISYHIMSNVSKVCMYFLKSLTWKPFWTIIIQQNEKNLSSLFNLLFISVNKILLCVDSEFSCLVLPFIDFTGSILAQIQELQRRGCCSSWYILQRYRQVQALEVIRLLIHS